MYLMIPKMIEDGTEKWVYVQIGGWIFLAQKTGIENSEKQKQKKKTVKRENRMERNILYVSLHSFTCIIY